MSTFAVIRKSDGREVYRYTSDAPVEWQGFEFATHNHVPVLVPPSSEPPIDVSPVRISKLAFRNRFTQVEKTTIEFAATDNPNDPPQKRQLAAALRAQLADQRDAVWIDLKRADTRSGVAQLEALGLIAAGRAKIILDTPPTDEEIYRG